MEKLIRPCLVAYWTFPSFVPLERCLMHYSSPVLLPFIWHQNIHWWGNGAFIEWQTRTFEMWEESVIWLVFKLCIKLWAAWALVSRETEGLVGCVRIWPPAFLLSFKFHLHLLYILGEEVWTSFDNWRMWSQSQESYLQNHTPVHSKARLLAAILALIRPCCICWRLTIKPSVPGLSGACHGVWFVVSPWFCSFLENLPFHSLSRPTFGELMECARHSASHWVDNVKQNRSQIRGMKKTLESLELCVSLTRRPVSLWLQR